MNKSQLVVIFFFICGIHTANAQKYSNEFFNLGVGGRGLGMSNTQVAIANDVTAGYWNPAGLLFLSSDYQGTLMHSEYFGGIAKYDYGAFAMKVDSISSLGLSVIRFGMDDIPNTTALIDNNGNIDYSRITSFSVADYGFLVSYARKMKITGLKLGANVKVIYRQIGSFAHAWGFGIDAGLQYQYKKWQLGIMARDITSTFNSWTYTLDETTKNTFLATGNEIPSNSTEITAPRLILGAGRTFKISDNLNVLAALDMDLTFDKKRNVLLRTNLFSLDPHLGLEIGYRNVVFFRGGIGNIQDVKDMNGSTVKTIQPNIGLGVKIKKVLTIDYCLANPGNSDFYSNIFSLKIDLARKKP